MRFTTAFLAIVLIALMSASVTAQPPKPLVTIHKLAPGTASFEAIAAQQPTIAKFYFSKISQLAWQRGEVRLAYDDDNLYVAFKALDCGEGKKKWVQENDEKVPDDELITVVLSPANDCKTFCEFSATAAGKKSSKQGRQFYNTPTNVDWSLKTVKQGDTWTAYMIIPFKSMGVASPAPGTKWGAQFSRVDPSVKWPIFWAQARKDPREMQRAGEIVFAGPDRVTASISDVKPLVPGEQLMHLYVNNPGSSPAPLKVRFTSDAKIVRMPDAEPQASQFVLDVTAPPGVATVPVEFDYRFDGWHNLTISVSDSRGRLLAQTPGIPVRIPPYMSRVAHYWRVVSGLQPSTPAAEDQKKQLQTQLTALAGRAVEASGDRAKWDALKQDVDAAEAATGHLRAVCADTRGVGYAVGTETAITKIMRDKLFEGQFGQPAKIELAKNEFESTQVAIIAHGKPLQNVSVTVSDLTLNAGSGSQIPPQHSVIPASRVALNLVDFVRAFDPPYEVEYEGWYPDPLMDYKPFDVAQGGIRPVWVTVHTPEDAKAGVYTGTITIKPANAEETKLPLEVKVWDFAVPTTSHLKTAFAFMEDRYKAWYGEPMSKDQRYQAYQMLLEHRINPSMIYSKSITPEVDYIPYCMERGMNAICLGYTGGDRSESARAQIEEQLRGYEKFLKDQGWWDKAYIYGFDEPPSSKWPDIRSMYGWYKEKFPDLPRSCTVVPNEQLKGAVNCWIPLVANFDYDEAQTYIKDGDQVWWYICCGPEKPFPNWFVDYPAIDARILFWMNWKYRVPGFLYWTINRWQTQLTEREASIQKLIDEGKRWPEVPWNTHTGASFNGDGHLVYPGPDGDLLSSQRLECVRDGIDDYEYFYLLNDLVKQAESKPDADKDLIARAKKLLAVREDVVKTTSDFTLDPTLLYSARREVAEMIEKMGK